LDGPRIIDNLGGELASNSGERGERGTAYLSAPCTHTTPNPWKQHWQTKAF